ncbi:unnamed protein product [Symbiodinium necroappetens]|uniref:Uncharacterized protein n=1 Tax=Symbiodinium necroappetens TaxID=1628268 RepID=A0A812M4I0_9DINO|nr:unnamed protein product [Symbiodinium necroappetens]
MAAVIPEKVHFEPGDEALRVSKELSREPSLKAAGLNLVVDPTGKLLNRRKVVSRKDVIANPRVTKFMHLARRARSSHQAQLRELKNELDSESEDEDQTDDDSEALNSLAGHDTASVASSCSSTVTPPLNIPALSGDMQRVLAKLQAATKKEKADQASEPSDGAPEAKKKPKKAKGEIEDKLLPEKVMDNLRELISADPAEPWAHEDETGDAVDDGEPEQSSKKNKKKTTKKTLQCQNKKEIKKSNEKNGKENRVSETGDAEEPFAITRMKKNMAADCAYIPGSYKDARLKYIKRKRDKGWSWKEACQKWNASAIRASWLEGLSTNELKRRRFI